MIVVGIDPDSDKHGVAIYNHGELKGLSMMDTPEIVDFVKGYENIMFSIENVKANNFVYKRNEKASKAAQSKVALSIGRCQQAQTELEKWLIKLDVPYVLHKPQKGNWAKNKELFEKATGWKGRSNADTRSAAYFGYLALKAAP